VICQVVHDENVVGFLGKVFFTLNNPAGLHVELDEVCTTSASDLFGADVLRRVSNVLVDVLQLALCKTGTWPSARLASFWAKPGQVGCDR
jgi:hypothetical protein